jgi:hypothetical protein
MADALEAKALFAEPLGLLWLLVILLLSVRLGPIGKASPARPTIALASPRLVALDPDEATSAGQLLGSVAAEAMASMEGPR